MERGAWHAVVHRLARSQTQLKQLSKFMLQLRRNRVSYGRLVCSSEDQWKQEQAPLSGTHTVNDFIFNCCLTKMIALASF